LELTLELASGLYLLFERSSELTLEFMIDRHEALSRVSLSA
jgi:hypothetical protein